MALLFTFLGIVILCVALVSNCRFGYSATLKVDFLAGDVCNMFCNLEHIELHTQHNLKSV